ncbi:hypothetical protein GGH96_006079 [Coemansia sp. RSA 1972]|nr:hypothetical protein GGH96_006079 [Coemansia sp. RSA 1972]
MSVFGQSGFRHPRIDADMRVNVCTLFILSSSYGIKASNPDSGDTVTIAVCGGVYGLTAIMIVYAWCNYNYRPIKAKGLSWVTCIYLSTLLWYIGNIGANGHMWVTGAWTHCKVWIIWLRVLFCYVFASLNIVRFYSLDRVFNQKKPFTRRDSLIAGAIVIIFNVVYCLVNQLVSDELTVAYVPSLELCNVTQGFRIAALVTQWILWTGCGVLIYRLRNIQSSFNEFRESVAIFIVIIALLTESTVTYIHYKFYTLEKNRRIQKTIMDTVASNINVWLIIGYPVFMSIFRRHEFERKWIERLANDNNKTAYDFTSNQQGTTYTKMNDNGDSGFNHSNLKFGGSNAVNSDYADNVEFVDPGSLRTDSTLRGQDIYGDVNLPLSLRSNLQIRRPTLNSPTMFNNPNPGHPQYGRAVL